MCVSLSISGRPAAFEYGLQPRGAILAAAALRLRSLEMPDRRGGAGARLGSRKISRSNPESSFIAGEFLSCGISVDHNGL